MVSKTDQALKCLGISSVEELALNMGRIFELDFLAQDLNLHELMTLDDHLTTMPTSEFNKLIKTGQGN